MKRRGFLKSLIAIPTVGFLPKFMMANTAIAPEKSGLDIVENIIKNDKKLNKNVSQEDMETAISCAKRMNEIILEAIVERGLGNDKKISIADVREINDYIFHNYYDEWIELHGDDEEDSQTGFHKVVNNGAKTKIFGKNAIDKVFDGIYHLGFNTHLKNRLINEDKNRNVSYANIAKWLNSLLKNDLKDEKLINPSIKEIEGETNTNLDKVVDIIYNDDGLKNRISIGDMRVGAYSANEMNKLILKAIDATNSGNSGTISIDNAKAINRYLVDNYSSEWIELHGDDENGIETGFHRVQKDGAKTEIFGKNAINKVFDGIYHLGFETPYKNRLVNEDGNKNVSFKNVSKWLTSLLKTKMEKNKEPLKILIPLYSYPTKKDENGKLIWDNLIEIRKKYKNAEVIAIVNPDNGDFNTEDTNYSNGIKKLVEANIKVVGYVYTNYAQRDIAEIYANIDSWKEIYNEYGVSGIFFDETSISVEDLEYYKDLSNYTRESGFDYVILNPGITTEQSYIDSNIADIITTLERREDKILNNPPKTYNTPSENTKLSLLINRVESGDIDNLLSFARDKKFTYIYFTEDGVKGNPWDSLSKYFEEEISKLMV